MPWRVRLAQGLQVLHLRHCGSARPSPGAIANTGRDNSLPVHAGDTLARVKKAQARLSSRRATGHAGRAGASRDARGPKLVEALRFRAEPCPWSEPLREDGDAELGDVVETARPNHPSRLAAVSLSRRNRSTALRHSMSGSVRSAGSLRPRPGRAEDPREVGEHFNLTRERIRQIEPGPCPSLRAPPSDTRGTRPP